MTLKEQIVELSDQLLTFLLDYRKQHPTFRFWLRSRENGKAGDQERLSKGQWFQGSHYIFLSFHSASGHVNMTRSIGWVVEFDKNLVPETHISIVWPRETDQRKIDLYHDLIQKLGGFEKLTETKYRKELPKEDLFKGLLYFLDVTRLQIDEIINEHGLSESFTISEEKFQKQLKKILYYWNALRSGQKPEPVTQKSGMTDNSNNDDNSSNIPLNLILYGPPGTGKTYSSINKSLEILGENLIGRTRKEIKEIFTKYVGQGRIVLTTFHQSLSYEDFIEGIKPMKPSPGEEIKYDIEKGLFKRLCETAQSNYDNSRKENREMLPFEEAFEELKDEWEANPTLKFPLKTPGYDFTIIGFTNTSIQFRKASGGTGHTLSINTLKEQYYGKKYDFKGGVGIYYPAILNKLFSYKGEGAKKINLLNYVLIIDEINRGNVSQIFGELITLLESDKRQGRQEALSVLLPYSKEEFFVPPNLYIVGTMNTADRSVEALDTALRRRFSFEEIIPESQIIQRMFEIEFLQKCAEWDHLDWENPQWKEIEDDYANVIPPTEFELFKNKVGRTGPRQSFELYQDKWNDLDIQIVTASLLQAINTRILVLLDRDHLIGHSFFIGKYTWEEIETVFYNNIIPLLQEYFYGDYGKIGLVIGKGFIKRVYNDSNEDIFAEFDYDLSQYNEKITYKLIDYRNPDTEHIIQVAGKEIEMDFEKAISLLLKKEIIEE